MFFDPVIIPADELMAIVRGCVAISVVSADKKTKLRLHRLNMRGIARKIRLDAPKCKCRPNFGLESLV